MPDRVHKEILGGANAALERTDRLHIFAIQPTQQRMTTSNDNHEFSLVSKEDMFMHMVKVDNIQNEDRKFFISKI